jgi:hypothetical protein
MDCKEISPGPEQNWRFYAKKRNSFAIFLKKAPCTRQAFWNAIREVNSQTVSIIKIIP